MTRKERRKEILADLLLELYRESEICILADPTSIRQQSMSTLKSIVLRNLDVFWTRNKKESQDPPRSTRRRRRRGMRDG